MNYKSIEELSIIYLEAIGFKHNDHVCVLFKNGDIQHGKLNFHGSFVKLSPTENIVIPMYNALALCHVNFIKPTSSQSELYNLKGTYTVTCKLLNIHSKVISDITPKQVFNEIRWLRSSCWYNMDIDIEKKTIKVFTCSREDSLDI